MATMGVFGAWIGTPCRAECYRIKTATITSAAYDEHGENAINDPGELAPHQP